MLQAQLDALLGFCQTRQYAEAEGLAYSIIRQLPDCGFCWKALGFVLAATGREMEALDAKSKAVMYAPDDAEAHCNLGNALQEASRFVEAEFHCRRAIALKPDLEAAYNNLGLALNGQGRQEEASAAARQALALKPDYPNAYQTLGLICLKQGRFEEAKFCFHQAIKLKNDYEFAWGNLGYIFSVQGQLGEALVCYRRALEIRPNFPEVHSNLIFALDMQAGPDTVVLQAERRRWVENCASGLKVYAAHENQRDPERKLRVGYVSADFHTHSAASVFGMMLTSYDRERFAVYAYSNSVKEDDVTKLFRARVDEWCSIVGQPDEEVAERIRVDEIDILVDLSGHSAGNRLLVFARKPAPVQVTAWGYIGGTGLKAVDVFFADEVVVPEEERGLYAEEVRYLPSVVGSYFPLEFPEVEVLPALAAGRITFGSFNRLAKLSEVTVAAWSRILQATPGSRLLLKTVELEDEAIRTVVLGQFARYGVELERIELRGKTSWRRHVAASNDVDIALDPFPHGGGVTALESLMMGVPMVSLKWPTVPGRLSASLLTTLGLTDWIAESVDEYVSIALAKASDLGQVAALRGQLRKRFSGSILGNVRAYVTAVELEYRELWKACVRSMAEKEISV